jgi:F-type H+-transporting ATPase subunit a
VEVLEELPAEVDHLLQSLSTLTVGGSQYGSTDFVLTTYVTFMMIAIALLSLVMFLAVKRLRMVPDSRISNAVESLAQFVRDDIAAAMIPHGSKKHFPFLATVFFFILINNLVGLVPGSKPGTGTMGITVALSTIVFVYFNATGFRNQGAWGYIKSFAPHGVPFPINLIVWFIEVFSAFLRIFTLAVRLFANMYAGHIILGIFAILTSLFAKAAIQEFTAANFVGALPSLGWLTLMIALYLLEVLVAFVQAYVFTLLSAVYIGQAAEAH